MKRIIFFVLSMCVSVSIGAESSKSDPLTTLEPTVEQSDATSDTDGVVTRATPQTVVFNNVLVRGGQWIEKNLTVAGAIVSGPGNVITGPATATTNAVPRFTDSTGSAVKNSTVLIDDAGAVTLDGITKNGNTVVWPSIIGASGTFLGSDGAGNLVYGTPAGGGNVNTALPFSSDNRLLTTDVASGVQNIQQTGVALDTANNMSGIATLDATAVNATALTGSLTGAASLNVLKSGDVMTGNLNLAAQSALRLQDAAGGEYIGLQAPVAVGSSYTLALPSTVPTANQLLAASATPTNLQWITQGASVVPTSSKTIYVTKFGNDTTGDGSFTTPFATLAKALDVANSLASTTNPIAIKISAGIYVEDNSAGPLTATASGISILGETATATIMRPSTLSNTFISTTRGVRFINISFEASGGVSTATGVELTGLGNSSSFNNVRFANFNVGVLAGGTSSAYLFDFCIFRSNGTGLSINDVVVIANNCSIQGATVGSANTGVFATGSSASSRVVFLGGLCGNCNTAYTLTNGINVSAQGTLYRLNNTSINQSGGAQLVLDACLFEPGNTAATVNDIVISGVNTISKITGCTFNGLFLGGSVGTAVQIEDEALATLSGGEIDSYTTALSVGTSSDTASTVLEAASVFIRNCTNDIIQRGTSKLNFQTGTASGTKITINDSTNVQLSYFDPDDNNTLQIGAFADRNTKLIGASIGAMENPQIDYLSNVYSTQAIGYNNVTGNPATWFALSNQDAHLAAITTDRAESAAVRLVSDTGGTVGGTTALRGWDLTKNGTSAELTFQYQNTDSLGQAPVAQYTVMQLDGVNNQVQLPTAATQIVFGADTNLYRSAADTLKTDDNVIVGGLTSSRALATDANKQLVSSATTATELDYLSGATSSVQAQLDGKVAKAGDAMTGSLALPAGTTAAPSLHFTGSTTTGLSASSDSLAFSTSATQRMLISSAGTVQIANLNNAGVVHTDASGNLSTSQIVNADVSASAAIADAKLATITSAGKVSNSATTATSLSTNNAIVSRDTSGNFAAGTITAALTGAASLNVLKAGDTMTGALVLPAGSASTPSLQFSGSANTGLSATAQVLTMSTDGQSRLEIDASGNVAIDSLSSAGLVHASSGGALSSSLLVNADITDATIANAKLATVSSANTGGNIVVRDGSGNFAATMITIDGTVSNPTDVATKDYVDSVISTGLVPKDPAVVASETDVALTGLQTIDGVVLVDNDRVLLVGQTNSVENGLWQAHSGAWTRPTDFSNGSSAGQAYVLILSGTSNGGSSWLCNTPTAIIDTDSIAFALFSLPDTTTGANVGTGIGKIFKNKTGNLINFKSLAAGAHILITNGGDDVTFAAHGESTNTPSSLVLRDDSGNFAAETITAALTGAASSNVLKAGDTMTGTLNLAAQSELRLQDASGSEYVGLQAPAAIGASYTAVLPSTAPTANQVLSANSTTPTNLEWVTSASSVVPSSSRVIYVAKTGNDTSGDGSQTKPYLTLSKAISIANTLSSTANPIVISINPGIYTEDNSAGALTVTANGITILNSSTSAVTIRPATASNNLLQLNTNVQFRNLSFAASSSTAAGIVVAAGATFNSVLISGFNTGISLTGGTLVLATVFFISCATGLNINNTTLIADNCTFSLCTTGTTITGSSALVLFNTGLFNQCTTAASISNNANVTIKSGTFRTNTVGVSVATGGQLILQSSSFALNSSTGTITNIQASGAGTAIEVGNCTFSNLAVAANELSALSVTGEASAIVSGGEIKNYKNALVVGTSSDTVSTVLDVAGVFLVDCTNDIIQQGTSKLNFQTGTASGTKITINDSTNVQLAYFDPDNNDTLQIGAFADRDTKLIGASIGAMENPQIDYLSNVYSTQAIGYNNVTGNPATWFALSNQDAQLAAITTDRAESTAVRLVSDTGGTVGGTTALRGWDVTKNGTSAELAFQYQNTDSSGQAPIAQYTVMQLDGINNQVQLPTAATQIVFAGDTNVYRSAADTLKTDDNLIVGGLTVERAVATDANKQLVSSATTATELGYLSGATSSVQTQLDGKVAKAGDTMTGSLALPAGTTAAPSLHFTGSTTTGLSASSDSLAFSTSATQRMLISSAGTVQIANLNNAGVVHTDASGNLSTSQIVNADVSASAAIADAKLATITSAGKVSNSATTATDANTNNAIVARDANGNFSAGTITAAVVGAATLNLLKAGDTMTGSLVLPAGSAAVPSLNFTGSATTGLSAAGNSLSLSANGAERINISSAGVVKVNGMNAAGVVHTDASGNLSTSTVVNADISATAAIADTKLATISTAGKVSNSATTATNANTANAIVARDASGNFSAGTITAAVVGAATLNVLKAGDTMTGNLVLPAGTTTAPSLRFTGSTTTGLAAATANALSLIANGAERMNISSGGTVKINGLNSVGFVRTDASGNLSTSLVYGNFYALVPPDTASFAVGASIAFGRNGPANGVTRSGGSSTTDFVLPVIGTYEINWQVPTSSSRQLTLYLDSGSGASALLQSVVGHGASPTQIVGSTLITTTAINSILSVRNTSGTTLTIDASAGGSNPVSATITIKLIN